MKPNKPPKKPAPYTRTKSGGAVGDSSMAEMEEFMQSGSGVDETVKAVGDMPNESIMRPEDNSHLR